MGGWHAILTAGLWTNDPTYNMQLQLIKKKQLFLLLTYLVANYGMPNYYNIHRGVGTQAGNMEDIGMMVEMESLYLYSVAYNNLNYVHMEMWECHGVRLIFVRNIIMCMHILHVHTLHTKHITILLLYPSLEIVH